MSNIRIPKSLSTNRLDIARPPHKSSVTEIRLKTNSVSHQNVNIHDRLKINDDIESCHGNLGNLKATLREQKKKDTFQEKSKLEDLEDSLVNMKSHLDNVLASYSKLLKRTSLNSWSGGYLYRDQQTYSDSQNMSQPLIASEFNFSQSEEGSTIEPLGQIENINHFSLEINDSTYALQDEQIDEVYSHLEKTCTNNLEIIENKAGYQTTESINITIEAFQQYETERNLLNDEFNRTEKELRSKIQEFEGKIKNKDNCIDSLMASIRELMGELEKGEMLRRKLHNYIQELRGNIRVYCRVKPVTNVNIS
jgi:hypothetical protein